LSIKEESDSSEQQHSSKPQPVQQQRKRRQIVAIHSLEASHANKALLPEPPIISQPILPQQLQQTQHQQFPHQMLNNQMNPMQQQNSNVFMNPMVAGIGIPLNNPAVFSNKYLFFFYSFFVHNHTLFFQMGNAFSNGLFVIHYGY
jgi:hypothetical protein